MMLFAYRQRESVSLISCTVIVLLVLIRNKMVKGILGHKLLLWLDLL